MAIDSIKAASQLADSNRYRSSINRSYFAVYAAITDKLREDASLTFGYGNNNPDHGRLIDYVAKSFRRMNIDEQIIQQCIRTIRDLYRDRIRADYAPAEALGNAEASDNLKAAESLLQDLGVQS